MKTIQYDLITHKATPIKYKVQRNPNYDEVEIKVNLEDEDYIIYVKFTLTDLLNLILTLWKK